MVEGCGGIKDENSINTYSTIIQRVSILLEVWGLIKLVAYGIRASTTAMCRTESQRFEARRLPDTFISTVYIEMYQY